MSSHGNSTTSLNSSGLSGGYDDPSKNFGQRTFLAVLISIACYNAIEIVIVVLNVFKKYQGLYFWSMLLSAGVGVTSYSIGFLIKFFELGNIWLSLGMLTVGWYFMVTGQSLVLYSRLHLVLHSQKMLRNVLIMICANVVLLHFPTTFFTFTANVKGDSNNIFIVGYGIMERIQMTGFCIQEFIISGFYIFAIIKLLSLFPEASKRKLMYQLLIINFIVIAMDIALLGIEFANQYAFQITFKGVVYSVKLKLELAVLNNLVDLIQPQRLNNNSVDSVVMHYTNPQRRPSMPARCMSMSRDMNRERELRDLDLELADGTDSDIALYITPKRSHSASESAHGSHDRDQKDVIVDVRAV